MIDTEKLLLELDDIKNDIEKRLIIIENSTMYIGKKDLDKSKQIAKLEVINKVIDVASRLDREMWCYGRKITLINRSRNDWKGSERVA